MSDEEIAFYDALAENESAVQAMGDDKLRVIAHELLMSLRENVTVNWAHRESARARMRVLVKRILRKYGYPPDLENAPYKRCCSRQKRCQQNGLCPDQEREVAMAKTKRSLSLNAENSKAIWLLVT